VDAPEEILGSHYANAYECTKANKLIENGQNRPVLWRTLGFEGVVYFTAYRMVITRCRRAPTC
jgi:hypothetical protein